MNCSKLIVVLLLALQFSGSPVYARAFGTELLTVEQALSEFPSKRSMAFNTAIEKRQKNKERINKSWEENVGSNHPESLQQIGNTAQTLVLMMVLTGAEIVRQEISMSHLKKDHIKLSEITDLSEKAALQILDGGPTWSSLLGAGAVEKLAHKPLAVLNSMINKNVSRKMLASLLTSGIASYITFMGWEAGGQLWEEARELITDNSDYEAAKSLWSVVGGDLFSNGTASQHDQRILRLMFGNMMKILILDNDLRNEWLYNTWRMRIATGDFVSIVGSMVSAGLAGTAIFPGAGTIGGMAFGLVGGVISLWIPQNIKDNLTDSFIEMRASESLLHRNQIRSALQVDLDKLTTGYVPLSPISPNLSDAMAFTDATDPSAHEDWQQNLILLQRQREDFVSIKFEKNYRLNSRIDVLKLNLKMANESKNQTEMIKIQGQIEKLKNLFKQTLNEIEEFYTSDITYLTKLSKYTDGVEETSLQSMIQNEGHASSLITALKVVYLLDPAESGRSESKINLLISKIYFGGFHENPIH